MLGALPNTGHGFEADPISDLVRDPNTGELSTYSLSVLAAKARRGDTDVPVHACIAIALADVLVTARQVETGETLGWGEYGNTLVDIIEASSTEQF